MKITQAAKCLRAGLKVRRPQLPYWVLSEGPTGVIGAIAAPASYAQHFLVEDLLADDWEVVPE